MFFRVIILFTFYFCLSFFVSCQKEQVVVSPEELHKIDSLALHIAVMPVMDCLPIYYAQRMEMFTDEGLDVCLDEYLSQMDCDTSLTNKHSAIAYTDVARLLLMPDTVRVLTNLPGKLTLVTAKTKRIKKLKHLQERMIALERHSTSDYWSDQIMKEAGLEQSDIYRPQINDVRLRKTMLTEQLVDAALLPEPYATEAMMAGNKKLTCKLSEESIPQFNCLAVLGKTYKDSLRNRQITTFLKVYDNAVNRLNSKEADAGSIRSILLENYSVSPNIVDSVQIPSFPKIQRPNNENINEIARWLQSRERTPRSWKPESLTKW